MQALSRFAERQSGSKHPYRGHVDHARGEGLEFHDRDELVDPDQTLELAENIAGSRLLTYERPGHFVHWERPDWLARELVEFVAAGGPT